jgi:hypothetical protein
VPSVASVNLKTRRPTMAAALLVALLAGDTAGRQTAYAQLNALVAAEGAESDEAAEETTVEIALACIEPLFNVLLLDVSQVDNAEARQARLLFTRLLRVDPVRARAAAAVLFSTGRQWATPDTAVAQALGKPKDEGYTRDEVILLGCDVLIWGAFLDRGPTEVAAEAELDEAAWMIGNIQGFPHYATVTPDDSRAHALVPLALDLLRDSQATRQLSQLEVTGVWLLVWASLCQRPAVCAVAVSMGIFELGVATLRASPPSDWVSCRAPAGLQAAVLFVTLLQPVINAAATSLELLSMVIESGVAEACVSAIQAFELRGVGQLDDSNTWTLDSAFMLLERLNLAAPEAAPIVTMLQRIPTALTFATENPVAWMAVFGLANQAHCALVSAIVLGSKESGETEFNFSPEIVGTLLAYLQAGFSGGIKDFYATQPFFMAPLVQLCKSDQNLALLVKNETGLVSLLVDALLLAPNHCRAGLDESIKSAIQADATDSLMQLDVFEPKGREMLQVRTANCIIIDLFSAFESGLVAPFLYAA